MLSVGVLRAGYALQFLRVVVGGVDAVSLPNDPWPFLGLHYVQVGRNCHGQLKSCHRHRT